MQRYAKAFSLDGLLNRAAATAAAVGAAAGPVIERLYGSERDWILWGLLTVIFGDWVAGIAASRKDGSYRSDYGVAGILRTIFLLWFPVFANILDHIFKWPGVFFYGVTFMLIYHTFVSATANAYRAGWERWIPRKMIDFVGSEIANKANRAMRAINRGGDEK